MLLLILKSSACLAVFMVFYKLFLEKASMHHFKRIYLLGALVVSILIPFITFTQYIEVAPVENLVSFSPNESTTTQGLVPETKVAWQDFVPTILWSIYLLGVILFSFRFAINLKSIVHRIKTNPKHQYHEFTNVLLQDLIHPHTFFKYIFLNKTKYENNQIPNAVLLHEQTHAKQKHALDILCIEVLQIIFWFNPLLYFIKKDIKLNHEFLADQAVLQKGIDSSQYKQTLLTFSSNATEPQLTNAINYSLIKKRFTVMKTQTSQKSIWLRSLVLLPLLAITLYSFSSESIEYLNSETKKAANSINDDIIIAEDIEITVYNEYNIYVNTKLTSIDNLESTLNEFNETLSYQDRKKTLHVNLILQDNIEMGIITDIKEVLKIHGVSNLKVTIKEGSIVSIKEELKKINAHKINYLNENQDGASKEQIAEYNKLSKKYNSQPINKRIYKQSDIKRLKYLYELMSAKQKENAEAFPKIAPPPPPPSPVSIKVASPNQPPPPPLPANATKAQKVKYKEAIRDAQVAAKVRRIKADKEKMVRVREIRTAEDRKKIEQEKQAFRETQIAARALKHKAQKEQRVQVREIRSADDRKKLEQEKQAYRETQIATS